jgi:hypothetical protein
MGQNASAALSQRFGLCEQRMITLVLLPGMDGTGELFEPFIAALGDDFEGEIRAKHGRKASFWGLV